MGNDKKVNGIKQVFKHNIYVSWFKFILGLNFNFLLFLGMVMSDNEFETKEIKNI